MFKSENISKLCCPMFLPPTASLALDRVIIPNSCVDVLLVSVFFIFSFCFVYVCCLIFVVVVTFLGGLGGLDGASILLNC